MNRTDRHIGRLHYIRRTYRDNPQYGCILWGVGTHLYLTPTLDVWWHRTLHTLRWVRT